MLNLIIYCIAALLIVFTLTGLGVLLVTLRSSHTRERDLSERERSELVESPGSVADVLTRYVGPVEPRHALLNAPARVAVEAFTALLGFPGLGWLISGKVITGLTLLVIGPSVVWGLFPAYLVATGRIAGNAYVTIEYLPLLALASAVALAAYQLRISRSA